MDITYLQISTLVLAIFTGVCLFIVARYIRVPAIVLLLVGGIVLGPEFLGLIHPSSLGDGLRIIISICVAIILFEGGLTLNPKGWQKTPRIIWRLLTLGVLVTWLGTTGLIYLLFDFSLNMALLAGSLIIVTGPTVIAPLLKRIQIKEKIYHVLHWEGVLIDPIGVFIAILCFEWMSIEGGFLVHVSQLSYRLLIGIIFGYLGGKAIALALQKEIISEEQSNIFVFASALFLYGISDFIVHEAGILTVVIAGLVVGWANPPRLKHIKQFKSELTEISIALVFILLAANLQLKNFSEIGWNFILLLGGVLFVIRPLSILLCSYRTALNFNEKLFLSWIAPRGVVAGSMASLFGIQLMSLGNPDAIFLETFTFSIIATTIILQGGTASLIAKFLKVEEPEKRGWLIIGAHLFSRKIAEFIANTTKGHCVFLDTNADAIREAQQAGLVAYQGNALSTNALPVETATTIGHLLALTDNRDLNQLICEKWSGVVEKHNLYRWSSHSLEEEKQIAGMGNPIWFSLTKPSQLSYDFKNQDIQLRQHTEEDDAAASNGKILLMGEQQGKIFFNKPVDLLEDSQLLVLERFPKHLTELLSAQHVLFIEADSYQHALQQVLRTFHDLYPEMPHEQIASGLMEREKHFPTTLANGVAAPHFHCVDLVKPLCFVAKIPKGVELHTYEGELVRLLFVLLSPENQPELHLRLLAEIAKIASTPDKIQQLLSAPTVDEVVQQINEKS